MYKDFELLIDGNEAFPEIIKCIDEAQESIKINMFIWRYDNIGIEIAKHILDAANRGVKVFISKDRYGVVLEKAEESKQSLFHKKRKFIEKISYKTLKRLYPSLSKRGYKSYGNKHLYKELLNNKNIVVEKDKIKKDHSKYYIFDDKILILGGINIEDKENGKDKRDIKYQDYMVKLTGIEYVSSFKEKLEKNINSNNEYFFGVNNKEIKPNVFEMKKLYLDMINKTKNELLIIMPYFHNVKEITKAIINAVKRSVNVSIMIPRYPNFQKDTNNKCMKKLMKKTNNKINLYYSPKMTHTKLIMSDDYITIGSTNITNKSFNVLSELNLFIKNIDSDFKDKLINNINENINLSRKIETYKDIKYSKFRYFLESMFV